MFGRKQAESTPASGAAPGDIGAELEREDREIYMHFSTPVIVERVEKTDLDDRTFLARSVDYPELTARGYSRKGAKLLLDFEIKERVRQMISSGSAKTSEARAQA